jgi:asparaginyl-tRNA synthetase
MPNILARISLEPEKMSLSLRKITKSQKFPEITFDKAISVLVNSGNKNLINFTKFGRDLTSASELKLAELLKFDTPFWIKNYDRDRVAFYQKPRV